MAEATRGMAVGLRGLDEGVQIARWRMVVDWDCWEGSNF